VAGDQESIIDVEGCDEQLESYFKGARKRETKTTKGDLTIFQDVAHSSIVLACGGMNFCKL
jgi:hypothetical protein